METARCSRPRPGRWEHRRPLGIQRRMVASAIAHSEIPIVSAIGHRSISAIADFVADLRAPTPSAAAELIVPDIRDLERQLREVAGLSRKNAGARFCPEPQSSPGVVGKNARRELRRRLREAQQEVDWRGNRSRAPPSAVRARSARLTSAQLALKAHHPARKSPPAVSLSPSCSDA